ncbi:hypothetical protein BVY04_00520 [bacterium M21]|nr:hypothetical protein BVY04_00520 [bacterium M21]
MNQYFQHRSTDEQITNMASEIFSIELPRSWVFRQKKKLSEYYHETFSEIQEYVLSGSILHIDETRVSIKGKDQYIFVFTNLECVFYLHRESRETAFPFRTFVRW